MIKKEDRILLLLFSNDVVPIWNKDLSFLDLDSSQLFLEFPANDKHFRESQDLLE